MPDTPSDTPTDTLSGTPSGAPRDQGLKSKAAGKPLRSRGFLSQPGGQAGPASGAAGDTDDGTRHHRSRGARQVTVSSDRKPQDLSPAPVIGTYRLEDT